MHSNHSLLPKAVPLCDSETNYGQIELKVDSAGLGQDSKRPEGLVRCNKYVMQPNISCAFVEEFSNECDNPKGIRSKQ